MKWKFDPYILAHHPDCDRFSHHTFTIRGIRFCMGCFIIYPSCILALILLNIPFNPIEAPFWTYLAASFIFLFINLIRKIIDPKNTVIQTISRMLIGISLALAITSLFKAPEVSLKIGIGVLILIVAVTYNLVNGFHTWNYCKSCPRHDEFPNCENAD